MIFIPTIKVFIYPPDFKLKLINKLSYFLINRFFYYIIFLSTIIYPILKAISFKNDIFRAFNKSFSTLLSEIYYIIIKSEY